MRDYHINIFYSEQDGGYIADIPDLEACSAFGETPEEALRQVNVAKAAWIEAARAEGKAIPEPTYRKVVGLVERMLALHQKLSTAAIPADKQLYQRQIEATDRQIDGLGPAQQQAGASCMA